MLRVLGSVLSRMTLRGVGKTFEGLRDMWQALGYKEELGPADYDRRYARGGIAKRVMNVQPKGTWPAGCEILENEDPNVVTPFEQAVLDLDAQVHFWNHFLRADILAGFERYAVIVIGAPGAMDSPLPDGEGSLEGIQYLMPYRESHARIQKLVTDTKNKRFGQPETYQITHTMEGILGDAAQSVERLVHWSRVIHVVDERLESNVFGPPRLEDVWNYLDDLDKVVGGGSEAFWKTVYQGMQLDIDPEMDLTQEAKDDMTRQIDEFEMNLRRVFRTRGVKATTLGTSAVDFGPQAEAIINLICTTKAVPKRIFLGSERGELASSQDKATWDDEIDLRREQFAWPVVVKPFIDRLIEHNYLPKPAKAYRVRWPERNKMTAPDKAIVAQRLASLNKNMGVPVVTPDDIRDKVLGWDVLSEEQEKEITEAVKDNMPKQTPINGPPPAENPKKTQQSEGDVTTVRK